MEEGREHERWVGYVNWRNKPALRSKHGGMFAASFVLAVEIMENMAYLANASNLVTYLLEFMHFSPSHAANTVTNFMGTAFLLGLLGGFLSDAFFTTYYIYSMSALVEFLGLIILTVQARSASLKPPPCNRLEANPQTPCEQLSGAKSAMLYIGLYLTALGVGGIKGSLPAHGAEQFDESTVLGRKSRSTFFNYFIFCLSCGGLLAVTFVVWVEDNVGWQWGFGIATISIVLSIPVFLSGSAFYRSKIPTGSPLTIITKVLIAAILNRTGNQSPRNAVVDMAQSPAEEITVDEVDGKNGEEGASIKPERPSEKLKCLNRAAEGKPIHRALACTVEELEDTKIVLKLLPIFLSTIILNCCLAQLSTFSVQQAATMNTRLGGLTVPPASLPVFPVVFIMIIAPIYDHVIVPFARRVTRSEMGISHLQRIGFGLVLSVVAMAVAALVEVKRKRVAREHGMLHSKAPLPISFFWVAFQYLFLGSADLFTLAGLMEFFFSEAPAGMRSLATALSWASLAVGYFMSSVLVSVVNRATRSGGDEGWLSGVNLNDYHLERFYWLMCVLGALNFCNYLVWAIRYKYRSKNRG
ncbi:protein NRT1/ PTR FAMILY 4.6-like [Canna indica]|uniref:Protein NRT1/ PTR FAMILY 4.6-like n=1 Tax=Canna indica TaxID=4628 RepID=A0AAQ3KNA9_9LILI|nr:protein NRT1/ PTR FAMILY 4.6-like [Canna indica]